LDQKPFARFPGRRGVRSVVDRVSIAFHEVSFNTLSLWRRASRWTKMLVLAIASYGVSFSILTILRVYALSAFAYDLGVYNQSLYSTIFNRRFFYYTADLSANPSGSIFGVHFSPILILLLIPYAFVPSMFTLTVIQTWALALSAVPVFLLGKRVLRSEPIAFALALAYLLHPATQGVNWYDFHPQAFLPLALLAGLYFLEIGKWKYFVASMVFALLTIEMAAFLVAAVAVGSLGSLWVSTRRTGHAGNRKEWRILLALLPLCIAWEFLGRVVILTINPQNVYYVGGSGFWGVLGAPSILDIPAKVLTSPATAFAALSYDYVLKLWYLFALFAPVLFLPFRSVRALIYCSPWLVACLFSNSQPFYLIGDQYPTFVLPFIFYGAIDGLARPWRLPAVLRGLPSKVGLKVPRRAGVQAKPYAFCITTLVLLLVITPLGPIGLAVYQVGGFPSIGYHERAVDSLYRLIPSGASILTQNNLMPLVSDRLNAFIVPFGNFYPPGTSFNATMQGLVQSVDYMLMDFQTRPAEAAVLYLWADRSKSFAVVGAGDGAVLLRRNSSALLFFAPLIRGFYSRSVLVQNGSYISDEEAWGGFALRKSSGNTAAFWFGPYANPTPGVYEISYRLRIERPGPGTIIRLPVVHYPLELSGTILKLPEGGTRTGFELRPTGVELTLASFDVLAGDVPSRGAYFWFNRTFVTTTLGAFEFPGLDAVGSMGISLDEIRLEQRVAFGVADVSISWVVRQ
jgi:uncharacterized membrane protein